MVVAGGEGGGGTSLPCHYGQAVSGCTSAPPVADASGPGRRTATIAEIPPTPPSSQRLPTAVGRARGRWTQPLGRPVRRCGLPTLWAPPAPAISTFPPARPPTTKLLLVILVEVVAGKAGLPQGTYSAKGLMAFPRR